MPTYQRGGATIYYEESGNAGGFPLLLLAPGGMNSAIAFWHRMPFNPIEAFRDDFRIIAMDQRNCASSSGPLDVDDPWGMYVDDQFGLLDHLGIDRYLALGCCIGCSYILKHVEQQPGRMVAGVLEQPIGLVDSNHEVFQDRIWQPWGKELVARRDDLSMDDMVAFGRRMWHQDFVFSVPKETLPTLDTPLLVMTGNDPAHPTSVSIEVAELLPDSTLMDGWKDAAGEIAPHTVDTVRDFLRSHVPGAAK